jgi:response regulator RpfG family c-di-GMP phosphodiesterase
MLPRSHFQAPREDVTTRLRSLAHDLGLRDGAKQPANEDTPLPAESSEPCAADGSYLVPAAADLLDKLLHLQLLQPSCLDAFLSERQGRLGDFDTDERMGQALVKAGLITEYQLDRVFAGTTHGLVLGNYRVLRNIGSGGMGVVFLAEHCLLHRRVAVKVLPIDDDCPDMLRERFYAEMRVLAELQHENIAQAIDAGQTPPPGPNLPGLVYLVMELIEGGDLERYVLQHGPLAVSPACHIMRQVACGLQAAHDRHLVHRDIKPSNILLAAGGVAKLVDFGLARQFCSKLTDHRVLLGSLEFMPPEQSLDPSAVGKQADIYGLGATLFWMLTGQPSYEMQSNLSLALRQLRDSPPRRLRQFLPQAPLQLDQLLTRMLDRNPAERPGSALAVMDALRPFLHDEPANLQLDPDDLPERNVLIVDDEEATRRLHRILLEKLGCQCMEAPDAASALAAVERQAFDLVLLDLHLPDGNGYELCRRMREGATGTTMKIIIVSGAGDTDSLAEALPRGADDYIAKPFHPRQMKAKVQHAFRNRDAQQRSRLLADELLQANRRLRQSLEAREYDVRQAQNALLFTMAKMAESRDGETPGHLRRLQGYAVALAQAVKWRPGWTGIVDERFIEQLERCMPLHDIGKIGLPEEIMRKPAALTKAERTLVETHPLIGDNILEALAREHGTSLEFMGIARSIVRHHHERYDGRGYPDRLSGEAIPAAARLAALADVYDALRRERPHKPAMPHAEAIQLMLHQSRGQFDPILLQALEECATAFERIYREMQD